MDSNQDLKVTIRAIDEATSTLKKVRDDLAKVTSGMDKAGVASESMATSVFKGTLAYDALKKSLGLALNFLKTSFEESMNAAAAMAQVETNVKNAGFAFDELAPKIKEYGDNAVKLGFDDEEAAKSLSRLLLVTKDYDQARALTNLSMDLASNKSIELSDATRAILLVTQGNTKALREFGIGMDDNATTADVLIEAQKKLEGSTVALASTSKGQINSLTQEYNNLKQKIGDELEPVLFDLLRFIESNKGVISSFADIFIFLGKSVGFVAKGFVGFGKILATGISAAAESGTSYISKMAGGLNYLGIVSDDTVKKTEGWAKSWHDTTQAAADDALSLYDTAPKIEHAMDGTSSALSRVKNSAVAAGKEIKDLSKNYEDLGDALLKVKQTATDELQGLRKAHDESVTASKAKIDDLKKSLTELTASYQRASAEAEKAFKQQENNDKMGIAAALVAQRIKVNSLQGQFDVETDPGKKASIRAELEKEREAYNSTAQLRINLSNEITAVEARNSMTDIERAVADYTLKREQAEKEYADNRADAEREYQARGSELRLQIKQEKENLAEENKNYKQKKDEIRAYIAMAESQRLDTSIKTSEAIIKQIDKEIKKYNELAAAISRASSGKSAPISLGDIPRREHGGMVPGPVGTAVPIIAHGGETIIPASQSRGTGAANITLNLNYPQFRDQNDVNVIKDQINNALRDVIRIHKLQTS